MEKVGILCIGGFSVRSMKSVFKGDVLRYFFISGGKSVLVYDHRPEVIVQFDKYKQKKIKFSVVLKRIEGECRLEVIKKNTENPSYYCNLFPRPAGFKAEKNFQIADICDLCR